MLTRDQSYALIVHDQVIAIQKQVSARRYGVMSHKLPILIRTSGLVQALAFVASRKETIYQDFLRDLASTMGFKDKEALFHAARTSKLQHYMLLTQRILDALIWYKRFAQSILKVDASDSADEEQVEDQ